MVDCWAVELGGCSDVQSGEHVISASLFRGKTATVQGFKWCESEPKTIGLSSLKSNILCKSHNSALSPTDTAAQSAFDTLQEARRLLDARASVKPRRFWTQKKFFIDGPELERWFTKTAINLCHVMPEDELTWHLTGRPGSEPPLGLVSAAYGRSSLCRPLGLYAMPEIGRALQSPNQFRFRPISAPVGRFAGGLFEFNGFDFLIWLCAEEPPSLVLDQKPATPLRHIRHFRFTVGGVGSHKVLLEWPDPISTPVVNA